MANSIDLVTKYQPLLDEVYKEASLTQDLEDTKVKFDNSKTVKILKLEVPALGDYSRNSGFTSGDVTATWESWTLSEDRGREFSIDAMDDEETLDMTFGKAASEFVRTKVVPEIDMYRFAKMAQTTGVTTVSANLADGAAYDTELECKLFCEIYNRFTKFCGIPEPVDVVIDYSHDKDKKEDGNASTDTNTPDTAQDVAKSVSQDNQQTQNTINTDNTQKCDK